MIHKKHNGLERVGTLTLEKVFTYLSKNQGTVQEFGSSIRIYGKRLHTFMQKGIKCVSCGIEGRYFAVEREKKRQYHHPGVYHANLYALDEQEREVLMTRDHIVPLSKGGPDTLDNSQTMCKVCNERKGNGDY